MYRYLDFAQHEIKVLVYRTDYKEREGKRERDRDREKEKKKKERQNEKERVGEMNTGVHGQIFRFETA